MNKINNHSYITAELLRSQPEIWINPIGGYGDIIMISSALYNAFKSHGKKFKMIYRTQYIELLKGHPAIELFGYPPVGAHIVGTDYWSREEFNEPTTKALYLLTKIFGGTEPENDDLYLPPQDGNNDILLSTIPWKTHNVLISPYSEGIRKMMSPFKWDTIVSKLIQKGYLVIQTGKERECLIRGAYSLLGVTTPSQLIAVVEKVDAVITLDSFTMHAAKYARKPAVVLFGPTMASQYGYSNHFCLQANLMFCDEKDHCLGTRTPENYTRPCPKRQEHCMNQFSEQRIIDIILKQKK